MAVERKYDSVVILLNWPIIVLCAGTLTDRQHRFQFKSNSEGGRHSNDVMVPPCLCTGGTGRKLHVNKRRCTARAQLRKSPRKQKKNTLFSACQIKIYAYIPCSVYTKNTSSTNRKCYMNRLCRISADYKYRLTKCNIAQYMTVTFMHT